MTGIIDATFTVLEDGTTFKSKEDAINHQACLDISKILMSYGVYPPAAMKAATGFRENEITRQSIIGLLSTRPILLRDSDHLRASVTESPKMGPEELLL